MRSGLQKPGAIPFLALLVFLLLSLVPSLAKEWDLYNLHLGYIGSPRHEVRHLPRVKDGPIDVRSRLRAPPAPWKSWIVNDHHLARPRRAVLDTPPRSSMEVAATHDPEHPPSVYVPETSSFSRGVRALKTFLTKQLDDDRPIRPTSTLRNASATPMAACREGFSSSSSFSPPTVDPKEPPENLNTSPTWVLSMVRESWQQVCRVGGHYLDNFPRMSSLKISLPPSFLQSDFLLSSSPAPKTALNDSAVAKPTWAPTFRPATHAMPTQPSNQTTSVTAVEPEKEPDQRPEHMRGSCMAIVISLVVGVMWF